LVFKVNTVLKIFVGMAIRAMEKQGVGMRLVDDSWKMKLWRRHFAHEGEVRNVSDKQREMVSRYLLTTGGLLTMFNDYL
jgi:hypothetical protein